MIEKCLTYASEQDKKSLLMELCLDCGKFGMLMTDNYGNYVLQICLKKAAKKELRRLIECVEDHNTPEMCENAYARHVIATAESERNKISAPMPVGKAK